MKRKINKVAVLGSGTMGSGIAAHVANAGVPVVMLDMTREVAESARQSLLDRKPPPLMAEENLALIEVGSFDQDLDKLADCDWILEVVVEQLEPKQALYKRLDAVRKKGSIITSNTSGIPLADLVAGFPESFAEDFLITHFFNPPRYMGLLELVGGLSTGADALASIKEFCESSLGKEIVMAKDTPCFIANRIGTMVLIAGLHHTISLGLTVEEADALAGRPMGFPSTGIFGLFDLVGIDVFGHICANLLQQLDASDLAYRYLRLPGVVQEMLANGQIGRKSGAGFYRVTKVDAEKKREAIDLNSGEYREWIRPQLPSLEVRELLDLIQQPDRGGQFSWRLLSDTLLYSVTLLPEIADDICAVDIAMREGYQWKKGPFELLDQIGLDYFVDRLTQESRPVPELLQKMLGSGNHRFYRTWEGKSGYLTLGGSYKDIGGQSPAWTVNDLKGSKERIFSNRSATLWQAGDDVALLEFHSKMNAIDEFSVEAMFKSRDLLADRYLGLVIGSDAAHFSVGANLQTMLDAALAKKWGFLDEFINALQQALMGLKLAPFPIVGANRGMALGGGCEVLLHCSAIQAHSESNIGLVETRVGLIPAGGGCKETVLRQAEYGASNDLDAAIDRAASLVAGARASASAADARQMKMLSEQDRVSMHSRHILADAKALVLELATAYRQRQPVSLALPGAAGFARLQEGFSRQVADGIMTEYDAIVAGAFAQVMTGGNVKAGTQVNEQELLDLERARFVELLQNRQTQDRVSHMLQTGKPLRN